ncbi:LacI family DNA-binding transcriptional regulator [Granulicella mallensis]|uniref:Transcriptional regulator, LacI family n=1 Tax=Granulicella mallensis (strain ATCC BAA-1857 / DSM 23137 / MP5ACTX8) TaxID=682795 RepID=G8P1W4_GRAMM|nr:LacI family DNA-binding transcriptional regulator [Granulicella mallensis]AEU37016.1 transcriptional regulator, LacI family [Granulicella mallensis MP5ACTX8]
MRKTEPRIPTIREVAKLARVGLMTVSRVINNHPSVRPSTRKKVEAAIVQLGYRQNEAARLLKGQRAKMIGLIVPDLSDAFFASCAHTVQHIARAHGYMTLVVSSERDADLEFQQAELMASRKVSGLLIVTSTRRGDDRLRELQNTGLAIVAFDRPLPGSDADCVLVENRTGAEEATQHLISHGHKRIACVGYDEETYTIHERVLGYTHHMNAAGLKPNIALGLLTLDGIREWLTEVLASKNKPTAIFSLNHRTSIYLLQALAEQKLRIPQDMAIVGFDDFDLASIITPPLTTVAQSPVELARRSMGLLLERIQKTHDGIESSPAKILLPVKLMVRASCGPHEERPA